MRFPRMITLEQMRAIGLAGVLMLVMAAGTLLNVSFDTTPMVALIFCGIFLALWFWFAIFMASFAVKPVETVEIDKKEIRIYLGELLLRRVPTDRIKTVGIIGFKIRSHPQPTQRLLVLSYKSPQQLAQKGAKVSYRAQPLLAAVGQDQYDSHRAARAYLQEQTVWNPLWLELSSGTVEQLRQCLPDATFLFDDSV